MNTTTQEQKKAIHNALGFLNHQTAVIAGKEKPINLVPTARTRAALDLLENSTAEELAEKQTDLRKLAADLFNWSGKTRSTKSLMKALNTALNTPGKYSHAVELTAYVVALAPIMEPDRLARLFSAIDDVETVFAPAKYTIQLSHKLTRLLQLYPPERQEKLAYSLWVQSHQGRWWDMTAGIDARRQEVGEEVAVEVNNAVVDSNDDPLAQYLKQELPYSIEAANFFKTIDFSQTVVELLEQYKMDLLHEKAIDPDIALLSSYIPWLKPTQRPESPVGSLLEELHASLAAFEKPLAEKPRSFAELFPLYGSANINEYPFAAPIAAVDGKRLASIPEASLQLVRNDAALQANRTYMGNCTWSYRSNMQKGTYALYRIHYKGSIYNASVQILKNTGVWRISEINSRHNRGQVPSELRVAFTQMVNQFPPTLQDDIHWKIVERHQQASDRKQKQYKYTIA